MKTMLMLGVGCLFAASAASAAPLGTSPGLSAAEPLAQLVQDRMDRNDRGLSNRDRDQRHFTRDDDEDDRDWRGGFGSGRGAGMRGGFGAGMGAGGAGNFAAMHEQMREHMKEAFGGSRIRLRHGDNGLDIRCPSDVPFNECTEAAEKILGRLTGNNATTSPGTTNR